jgi:tetratricopeptide (TPR) repeat protein
MRKFLIAVFFILQSVLAVADNAVQDTGTVDKLNKQGFAMRMTDPHQTILDAEKAMNIAQKLQYTRGVGEAYRILGIGNYYLNQPVKAIDNYLTSLDYFKKINDLKNQGKVYNNIGNLYRDNDYDLSLEFFQKALSIAQTLKDEPLTASLYLNIGAVYNYKKSYYQALNYFAKSHILFSKLKDTVNLIQCLQNNGVVYFKLNQYDKAEKFLLEANKSAIQLDLNEVVASIDLTLATLYIAESKFLDAEKTIEEGLTFAEIIKDDRLKSDFSYTRYQLEVKRKNYKEALTYLQGIYKRDSVSSYQNSSAQINVIQEQFKQQARQKDYEFLLQRQQYDRVKFWAVAIVAGLLLMLVGVLINNVKRKAKTNIQLTNLNAEVSRQKDNLDRINHHLEEIIDERTKDLQIKNKKLSEYSSYLSHQIRGPIATLKGLMNLEKEGLVDQPECIRMMNKCVGEIDDKIIEMSDMLHDPGRVGF